MKKGIGFIGLLTLVFIVLQLTETIDWSWFWVLSPMVFAITAKVAFWVFVFWITVKD
jgi:hypothetical protein